ncbi:hypothetical protein [Leptospira alstonii]|uniref:PF14103 domain protein n=2 Tax=Leptospira alstonii TaxID=28452 RepID=M6CY50_9LEPT|nr:hypothetical protein [Leptospira alstonii]EMJ96614.1 hypothetical protein LEP1GSC194_4217 [Leptospira alstonii serovar Sichuan str. 79601]EQA78791.1 hypothetical protein LEP1GSC193_1605 [Leptospira alstonii serovar Pingchang str. 80-412]
MKIDIAGEDLVTQEIIVRILKDYRNDVEIGARIPARGSQIKDISRKLNRVSTPTILLTDLDNYLCASALMSDWLSGDSLRDHLLFRVACDEGESWLMSDVSGFSKWLSIDENLIPQTSSKDKRRPDCMELNFNFKPSLYLMRELAVRSSDMTLREKLIPKAYAKKGPEYNSALLPFIQNIWNIEAAKRNSYSLRRAVERIQEFQM